jgi:glucosylceramidase
MSTRGLLVVVMLGAVLAASCASVKMATIVNGNSTQCLNLPAEGNNVSGTPARIHTCDPFKDQQWNVAQGEISGTGRVCLTVKNDDTADGTPVVFSSCRGTPAQHWSEEANGHIVGLGGKCLDVQGGSAVQWAPLMISTCSDAATQKWLVQR